jgi:hypothetical protein
VWQSVETVDGQIHVHALDARLSCPPRAPIVYSASLLIIISCIVKRVSDIYILFASNDVAFCYSVRLFAWQLLFLQVLSLAIHHFLSQHPLINSTAIVC